MPARFVERMDELREAGAPWPGAVAVSGGIDSLALMHLATDWARARGLEPPVVLTVDHGLRPDSRSAARNVIRWAKKAGLKAHALAWEGRKPAADIEAAAREARYALMGAWMRKNRLAALYVAHTRDDQAETFLLRLARGSGLDGLAAMRPLSPYPLRQFGGLVLVRPLLSSMRDELEAYVRLRGQEWIDDPMNSDPRFARVRIRAAWPVLSALGLEKQRIADAAVHLSRAREALDLATLAVMSRACRVDDGRALLDAEALVAAPREVGLRALARLLGEVGRQDYRPRFERLERLYARIASGQIGGGCTLHGCRIFPAHRSQAAFGQGTLVVVPERLRID